jgi:hypothetical protein
MRRPATEVTVRAGVVSDLGGWSLMTGHGGFVGEPIDLGDEVDLLLRH